MKFDDERLQGILQARRVLGRAPFPGQDEVEVGVRLLTDREIDLARFEAQMYLEMQCKKVHLSLAEFVNVDPESLDREHQRQVIFRAFVDPETPADRPAKFFASIEQVRGLDSVVVQQLWELYVDWQDTVNPRLRLKEEEVEALSDALKKEHGKILLAQYERNTLASLVRIMAARPPTAPAGNSNISSTS